jgi:hypothetical protein
LDDPTPIGIAINIPGLKLTDKVKAAAEMLRPLLIQL